jgi:hypothetical protein
MELSGCCLVVSQARVNGGSAACSSSAPPPGQVVRRPEVIDDFIRNFYVKTGLTRTAEVFETEWYELKATGRLEGANTIVPDVYMRNGVSFPDADRLSALSILIRHMNHPQLSPTMTVQA